MSTHICSQCGHEEHIFGAGGGDRIAREYDTEVLGSLPLSLSIRESVDTGTPTVASSPESEAALAYRKIAVMIRNKVEATDKAKKAVPTFSVEDD
jgi:ATP-binding protein involved in chromosome partitioning